MSDTNILNTAAFFDTPNTITNFATALEVSREVAARRVKALVESGALKAVGKETRGPGIRGVRPTLYQTA